MSYIKYAVPVISTVAMLLATVPLLGAQLGSSRPIRVIVPFAPGGQVDIVARQVSQILAEQLGRPVIVDNRPGAGALIGTRIALDSAADGHTLLMGSASSLAILPSAHEKPPYDPLRDFAPISLVSTSPYVLVVSEAVLAYSVADLLAVAKAKPGHLTYGTAGVLTGTHLTTELFSMMSGVKLLHVPYKGSGPATIGLLGREVSLLFNNLIPSIPHIKSGRMRALAVTTSKRSQLLPDVPTIAESGVLNFESGAWNGLVMPAGGHRVIIDILNTEIVSLLKAPDVRSTFATQGSEVIGSTPDEFRDFIKAELAKWSQVIRKTREKK